MNGYLIKHAEIEAMEGLRKTHFLNPDAQRINKSLGDLTGLAGFGFHIIEVPPGKLSTEFHVHYHEDECVYVLGGKGTVDIGDQTYAIGVGDFIGYRAGGLPHTMTNTGTDVLKCIVVGARLDHDVGDYPRRGKRIFRNKNVDWNVVDEDDLFVPGKGAGKKSG